MQTWIETTVQGHISDKTAEHDRLQIITDISAMSALSDQLRYDPMVSKWERQCIFAIQQKLLRMIPMLSTISAYIRACRPSDQEAVIAWSNDALDHVRDDKLDTERHIGRASGRQRVAQHS